MRKYVVKRDFDGQIRIEQDPKITGRFNPVMVWKEDRERFEDLKKEKRENLLEIESIFVDSETGKAYFIQK